MTDLNNIKLSLKNRKQVHNIVTSIIFNVIHEELQYKTKTLVVC